MTISIYPLCLFGAPAAPLRLIGLSPFPPSSLTALPLKLAYLEPKKLPIPDPIPPIVLPISARGGGPPLTAGGGTVAGSGDVALSFSLRIRSASNLDEISLRTPSKALKMELEPVAMAEEPAVKADESASRVGASC